MPGGQGGQGATPGAGGPGAIDLDTLAEQLGVSADDLESALRDLQPEPPAQSGENPLVTALAGALGLPEAAVAAALEAVRPGDGAGAAPPSGGGTTPPSGDDDGTTTETSLS